MNLKDQVRTFFTGITSWSLVFLGALFILLSITSFLDYRHQKSNIMNVWQSQGDLLSKTILQSGRMILAADQRLEESFQNRLKELSQYFREIDSLNMGQKQPFRRLRRFRPAGGALVFDQNFRLEHPRRFPPFIRNPDQFIQEIKRAARLNDEAYFSIPTNADFRPEKKHAVVLRRSNNRGYIVVFPQIGLSFSPREKQGVRQWLNEIVQNPVILYVNLDSDHSPPAHQGMLQPADLPPLDNVWHGHSFWHIFEHGDQKIFEYAHRGPDGLIARIGLSTEELDHVQHALVERLLLYSFFILFILGTLSFYTMKKQSLALLQQKYRQVQTFSSTIIEEMDEGLIVFDETLRLETINRAALTMLHLQSERDQTGHLQLSDYFSPDLVEKFRKFERLTDYPFWFTQTNELPRYLLVSTNVFHLNQKDSGAFYYLILLRDFTSQKELESLRQRRSKLLAMGQLASRVAHEIRNPLNGIGVIAQRIKKEFRPEHELDEFENLTSAIREETARINAIIETFLTYARTQELKPELSDLSELIEGIKPVLSSMTAEKNIKLITEYRLKTPVNVDADQIKQVLINLLKNAVEASPENSEIRICTVSDKGHPVIDVEDQGDGISTEAQDKIFDLYFTTKPQGSGLGLSIVEKIITAHGGEIKVESPYFRNGSQTNGARFRIRLPV